MGWVAAGRRHGVAVLGTIITEWDAGQQLLESLLGSQDTTDTFVAACVSLARHYGFQGWLLNIEVSWNFVTHVFTLLDCIDRFTYLVDTRLKCSMSIVSNYLLMMYCIDVDVSNIVD